MAPVVPEKIKTFRTEAAFESWMRRNHAREGEVWLRIYKKGAGQPTVTIAQALDVALCWGWIDGQKKGLDDQHWLQRFTPRRARSVWSHVWRWPRSKTRATAGGRRPLCGPATSPGTH